MRARGFTLIELMVAMAIFAILASLAYGVLNQTLLNSEILTERMERLKAIQKTMRVISDDFLQLAPRPVRGELGERYSASLTTDFQSVYAKELASFKEFEKDMLLVIEENKIKITSSGRLFLRNIAMTFDVYLKEGEGRFSRTI